MDRERRNNSQERFFVAGLNDSVINYIKSLF